MSETIELRVHLAYDDEAKVWYVAKSDIPGLSLEADSASVLVERVMVAAPELLELNEGLIVEEVEAPVNEPRRNIMTTQSHEKPRMRWLPVFDTPLDIAHA